MTDNRRKIQAPSRWCSANRLTRLLSIIWHLSSSVWVFVRELSGETAFERQLKHAQEGCSRGELYQQHLEEKYSRPCRCC